MSESQAQPDLADARADSASADEFSEARIVEVRDEVIHSRTVEHIEELAASCKVEPLRRSKNEVLEYSKILGVEPWIPHIGKEIPAIAELAEGGVREAGSIQIRLVESLDSGGEIATGSQVDVHRVESRIPIGRVQRDGRAARVMVTKVKSPATGHGVHHAVGVRQWSPVAANGQVIDDI